MYLEGDAKINIYIHQSASIVKLSALELGAADTWARFPIFSDFPIIWFLSMFEMVWEPDSELV